MEILVLWKSSKKVLQCQFISRGLSEQKNDGETQFHSVTARWIGFPNRLQRAATFPSGTRENCGNFEMYDRYQLNLHRFSQLPILNLPRFMGFVEKMTRRRGHVRYGNPA